MLLGFSSTRLFVTLFPIGPKRKLPAFFTPSVVLLLAVLRRYSVMLGTLGIRVNLGGVCES